MSRWSAMYSWYRATPRARSDWFRTYATSEIRRHREYLALEGLHHGDMDPHAYELAAIDRFANITIEQDRDDDEAVEAARRLMFSISNAPKGSIPNSILYQHGCGSHVRATLLKEAWLAGKSGSVLALNGNSRTQIVSYFEEAERTDLMEADEHAVLSSLGEMVRIYRGAKLKEECPKRTAFALSWSLDYSTARRFGVHGHGSGQGVVLSADVPKVAILALWETSGAEPEVVVNPRRLRNIQIVEMIDPSEEAAAWAAA